nr:hypothetical protein KPHV_40320 [Kitasatospora purpeofusca]
MRGRFGAVVLVAFVVALAVALLAARSMHTAPWWFRCVTFLLAFSSVFGGGSVGAAALMEGATAPLRKARR